MTKDCAGKKAEKYLSCVLFFSPFFLGGFHLVVSCFFSISLFVVLTLVVSSDKSLRLYRNDSILSITLLLVAFGASALWAVDRGMAVFGLIHFFPILPFSLLMMQQSVSEKDKVLESVPLSGAIMTALSFLLRFIPALRDYFTVQGRLAGFFQYPNTFAAFLLVGIIVCLWSSRSLRFRVPLLGVLLFGILASGSRTVFILMVVSLLASCILRREKSVLFLVAFAAAVGSLIILIYVVGLGDIRSVGRFLTTSLSESTLIGRLLYYKDALPVILRHPFGLGYLGYYFSHHSFQTGVYSVMFIHNEPLQMLLDVGWIPSLVFLASVAENIFSKSNSPCRRMILIVLSLHCLLDFDFQFIAMLFVFLFCMDFQKGRQKTLRFQKSVYSLITVPLALVFAFFGVVQGLQLFGMDRAASRLYPAFTVAQINEMSKWTQIDQANATAERIIAHNSFVAEAYRVRAGYAYSKGNIDSFTENGIKALSLDPYNTEGYVDYGFKLLTVIRRGEAQGNEQLVQYGRQKLLEMQKLLKATEQKTDDLAWRIHDRPDFSLPEELAEYIQSIKGGQNNAY